MKLLRSLLVASLVLPALAGRAAVDPLQLIGDNAPVVLSLRDFPGLLKNWSDSPWARTWNDEQVKKFFGPLREQMGVEGWNEKTKAESGYTVEELLGLITGDALIAMTNVDFDPKTKNPPVLIAVEFGANAAAVQKLLLEVAKKKGEGNEYQTEDFAGVTVYTEVKKDGRAAEFSWAMVDGLWIGSPSKATLTAALSAATTGAAADAYGKSERFLRMKERTAEANVFFSLNLQALYPTLQRAVVEKATAGGAKPNGMLDPANILPALGVDALNELFFGAAIGESATQTAGGLTYSEQRGIVKLLAYKDGPPARPDFVSSRWISANTAKFSLRDAYAALEEIVDAISPVGSGMVQGQIKEYNRKLGIDIKRDLIGSLGEDFVTGYVPKPGASVSTPTPLSEMDQFFAVSLDNSTAFTNALEAIKAAFGPAVEQMVQKREYLGHTINTIAMPQAGPETGGAPRGVSYAITKHHLLVSSGSPAALESALQGLKGDQPTLWNRPEVKEQLAGVPAGASAITVQDNSALVGGLFETFAQLAPMLAQRGAPAGDGAGSPPPFDLSAKPDAATLSKYWGVDSGFLTRESGGLFFQSKLNHKK